MKQIAAFLKKAFQGKDHAEAAKALDLTPEAFAELLEGHITITPRIAVDVGNFTGIEPRDLMELQTEASLVAAGAGKRKPKEVATRDVSRATGTDGRPSQSPMKRERTQITMTFGNNVSADKAQRAVEAVSNILGD